MTDSEPEIIDADYRVVGEGRWEPFKRWARDFGIKVLWRLIGVGFLIVFVALPLAFLKTCMAAQVAP